MLKFINMRIRGEAANPPVLRCDHYHHKSDIPCKHAGFSNHCREECDFDHKFYGPCPEAPLCYHDGKSDHESQVPNCTFRHVKSFKKDAASVPAAQQKVAQAEPPPIFTKDDFAPLTRATQKAAVKWADEADEYDLEMASLDTKIAQALIDNAAKEDKKKKDAAIQKKLQIIAAKKAQLAALLGSLQDKL